MRTPQSINSIALFNKKLVKEPLYLSTMAIKVVILLTMLAATKRMVVSFINPWSFPLLDSRNVDHRRGHVRLVVSTMKAQKRSTSTTTTTSTNEAPAKAVISDDKSTLTLKELDRCTSATQAQRVLQDYVAARQLRNNSNNKNTIGEGSNVPVPPPPLPLYNSVQIPPGASTRPITDGDLAIQTRLVNKKYTIMDLIELSGNRDADRASWAVLATFVASTIAAGTYCVRMRFVLDSFIYSFLPSTDAHHQEQWPSTRIYPDRKLYDF
jgi:hypothetical protein